jgi:uncharacterized membrane protein YhfC
MYNFSVMDLLEVTYFLTWLWMIAFPILLGIILIRKFQLSGKIWWIGAAIFLLSQIFHLTFNNLALNPWLASLQAALPGIQGCLIISLLAGLSAGIFEEFARYGMFRWWLKHRRTWRNAAVAGAGHGGVESILLGVYLLYIYLNMIVLRNADLSQLNLAPDQLASVQQQVQQYWSTPWYATFTPFIERALTIPFHIMASVLVLQVFTKSPGRQQFGWLGLAVLLHTIMDGSAVFIANQWNIFISEAALGGLAVLEVIIIFALRQPEPQAAEAAQPQSALKTPPFTPIPVEESLEILEKTRFQ